MVHARTPLEAAQGALLGLACGDAAGGVLEFSRGVSAEEAAWAMTMPGGGDTPWPTEASSQAEEGNFTPQNFAMSSRVLEAWKRPIHR